MTVYRDRSTSKSKPKSISALQSSRSSHRSLQIKATSNAIDTSRFDQI